MKKKIYAVRKGRTTGLFADWETCKASVEGFPGAEYKSFPDEETALRYLAGEAPASPEPGKKAGKTTVKKALPPLKKGFYFDGGTGLSSELGLEVIETNLTDESGHPLLNRVFFESVPRAFRFGAYHERDDYRTVLFFKEDGFTNNFAELYGLYLALLAALRFPDPDELKNVSGEMPGTSGGPAEMIPKRAAMQEKTPGEVSLFPKIFGDSELILRWWSKGHVRLDDEKTQQLAREVMLLRNEFEAAGGRIEKISGDINPADLGFHR
ncbi:MAG: RNase H1/viroplasmin domain-containing protein [Lachnospiraceae bacterium]|nr:RNase H1/viroplasmin domain-containing protein [Lachnospiraceae bacterium]